MNTTRQMVVALWAVSTLGVACAANGLDAGGLGEGDAGAGSPRPNKAPDAAGTPTLGTLGADGGPNATPTSDTCPYTGPPVDVSTLAICSEGGRCVRAEDTPVADRSRLAPCAGGYCLPEKSVVNKGNYLPRTCKSVLDGEGRCASLVVPAIAAQKASLPQDVCEPNERCAPCFDPVDGKDTGACRTIRCDSPKTTAKTFTRCCSKGGTTRGRCTATATLTGDSSRGLNKLECAGAELCVPDEFISKATPQACRASGLLGIFNGPYDGVCMSECVSRDFLGQLGTAQGNCAGGSFCAPCKDPLSNGNTGVPGCPP